MTLTLRIGGTVVAIEPGLVTTTLPGGGVVLSEPHDTLEYVQSALALGYETADAMNAAHDLMHVAISEMLGLPCSPTLERVAAGLIDATPVTDAEEQAVMALARFANVMGVDLVRAVMMRERGDAIADIAREALAR